MMGWDEIFQPDIPKNIVIQSWRGQESLAKVARQGNQGILSNGYYIDLMYPASQHYAVDPLPADTTLTAEEQKRILGGEATMWSEWVSPETIDSRIWTRTAAIAERFWSPREVNDVDDMYRRLEVVSRQLEELGLTHRKNQAMLLRRLANGQDISALQTLVSVIEPVKEYRRYQVRPQTMLAPLTGLVDAAQADAGAARKFNKLIQKIAAQKSFSADAPQARSDFFRVARRGNPVKSTNRKSAGADGSETARRRICRVSARSVWRRPNFCKPARLRAPRGATRN